MNRGIFRRSVMQHRRAEVIYRQQGLPAVGGPSMLFAHEYGPNADGDEKCLHCRALRVDVEANRPPEECPARIAFLNARVGSLFTSGRTNPPGPDVTTTDQERCPS
jgi:hypothetical protein